MWNRHSSRPQAASASVTHKPQVSGIRDSSASPVHYQQQQQQQSQHYQYGNGDRNASANGNGARTSIDGNGYYDPYGYNHDQNGGGGRGSDNLAMASPRSMSGDNYFRPELQQSHSQGHMNNGGAPSSQPVQDIDGNASRTSIDRVDSHNNNNDNNSSHVVSSTPRSSGSKLKRFSWFGSSSRRRRNSRDSNDVNKNGGNAAAPASSSANPRTSTDGRGHNRAEISDDDGETGVDFPVSANQDYPYEFDGQHGYYDPNSYYYPGNTAYSNAAVSAESGQPGRPPSTGYGNSTVVSSQGPNGGNGHPSNNGNNNGNGGSGNNSSGGNGHGPLRRQSLSVNPSVLNQIEEDEHDYYDVSPAMPFPGSYHDTSPAVHGYNNNHTPLSPPLSQHQTPTERRSSMEKPPVSPQSPVSSQQPTSTPLSPPLTSTPSPAISGTPSPGGNMSSSAFTQANPLAKTVLRQQMQRQAWLSQQQQQLQQHLHQPSRAQMQMVQQRHDTGNPGDGSSGTVVKPPLPPPVPQLARGGGLGQEQMGSQQSSSHHQGQAGGLSMSLDDMDFDDRDDQMTAAGGRAMSPSAAGSRSAMIDPLAQHPLFREQSNPLQNPIHDQIKPPSLPPKEPLSRGSSAQDSSLPQHDNSSTSNNNNPTTLNNRTKSPGNIPQFPQQLYAHQRYHHLNPAAGGSHSAMGQPGGGGGKPNSPYTPQSMYTQSSTPDIPQRDTRRSTDYSAELDPMAQWQHDQGPHGQQHSHPQQQDFHQPHSPYQTLDQQRDDWERRRQQQQQQQQPKSATIDKRLQTPHQLFVANPDGRRTALARDDDNVSALSDDDVQDSGFQQQQQQQQNNDKGPVNTQWPLTPLAMPLVSEAVVSPLKPKNDWGRSCLEYFLSKYRDRLEARNWEKEPFREIMGVPAYPDEEGVQSIIRLCAPLSSADDDNDTGIDDILPHLLHDRLFYLAYAVTGSSSSTYSHMLWELFGASPGHLLTIYAALAATNGPTTSEPVDLEDYLVAAIEGRKSGRGVSRGPPGKEGSVAAAEKPSEVSMESLLNMVTRRLDEPGTSPYDFVLRQIKFQLRLMKSETAAKFGSESGWRTRNPVKFDRSSPETLSATRGLPLYHGLQQYLASKQHLIRVAMQRSCTQLPDLSALLGSSYTPQNSANTANNNKDGADPPPVPAKATSTSPPTVTLLLDVAGSGKTRLMRDKILESGGSSGSQGGGLYFFAPNLVPPPSSSSSSLAFHASHSYGAVTQVASARAKILDVGRGTHVSRDTWSLYEDLAQLERSGIGAGRPVLAVPDLPRNRLLKAETCLDPLFRGRKFLMDMLAEDNAAAQVQAQQGQGIMARQVKWAQLQMASCGGLSGSHHGGSAGSDDLFDLAYRFMRLRHLEESALPSHNGGAKASRTAEGQQFRPQLIIVDEAQAALGDPLAERIVRGMIDSCKPGGQAYIVGTRPMAQLVEHNPLKSLRLAAQHEQEQAAIAAKSRMDNNASQSIGQELDTQHELGSQHQQQQQTQSEDLVVRRVPCSQAHVDNSETFWSVLVHHAWSLVGEIYELRAQGFLESGGSAGFDQSHSYFQAGTLSRDISKRDSTQSNSSQNADPPSASFHNNPNNNGSHSSYRRRQQLRDVPLLTREGQPLSFDINLPGGDGSNNNTTSWAGLEASLQTWNVLNSTARDETIDVESTRFFGRVRWTATFAEELLRASSMVGGRNGYAAVGQASQNGTVEGHQHDTNGNGTNASVTAQNYPGSSTGSITTRGSGGRLSPDGVRAAAQRAVGRIKTALRQRLDNIRGTRCADELIWAALEADVFGASRWFEGPLAADLVSAGFALVEEDLVQHEGESREKDPKRQNAGHGAVGGDAVYGEKQGIENSASLMHSGSNSSVSQTQSRRNVNTPMRARLAEPLVIEAIMEYLYESPVEVLDKYMRRFFTPLQTDGADRECLWKIAEDVLAKKLHNTVRFTNDTISQHRRTGFFDILRTSRSPTPIHKLRRRSYGPGAVLNGQPQQQQQPSHHDYWTYGEAERFVGSLDRYYLQDSGVNIDRPGEWQVEDWLYETEEEHRPNFFFFDGGEGYGGDNNLGEDGALGCLFFLTDRENVRRKILCVLQFAPAPTTEITTSTDPETNGNQPDSSQQPPRYHNSQHQQQHPNHSPFPTLTNLITHLWSNNSTNNIGQPQTPWPVFYIYVPPPSVEIDDDAFVAELSRTVKDKMPRNHYVGYVDIGNSDGIWGTTFPAWIGQMADEKRRQVQRQRKEKRRDFSGRGRR